MDKKARVLNTILFQSVSKISEFRGKITINSSGIFLNNKLVCSLDSFLKLQRREEFINLLRQTNLGEQNMKKSTELKFGNDNPLLPNDMKKGQSYITKDNQVVKFVKRETDLDSWDTKYYFSLSGRGNYAMTHDEVLDNVTYLNEMLMRKKTALKLRKLIERIIREESVKKSLSEKISKKDMKLMLDSGNTFREGKVTAVKDKGRYWITLDTPQYKGSRIYNNDNFEEFYKQITTYIRQYN